MGLLSWLGIGAEVAKPIEAVSKLYTTDKDRIAAQTKLEEELQKPVLAQLENNRLMAMSAHFFESAWPALIGWTSGACVALYYIPQLIIANYLWAKMSIDANIIYPFPIPADDIMNLVYLLFGFGTFHIAKKKLLGK